MPDDTHNLAEQMRQRGAEPVTLRFRPPGASTAQRHAAYRLPPEHPAALRIDRLYAARQLTEREYQNACAVAELCRAAGMFRSQGVAEWMRVQMGRAHGEDACPEDELRELIRKGGVEFQAVLMLLDPEEPPVMPYMWSRALKGLGKLDGVAARWDGQRWADE